MDKALRFGIGIDGSITKSSSATFDRMRGSAMLTPQIERLAKIKKHVENWNQLHSLIHQHPNIEIPMPLPQVDPFCDTMHIPSCRCLTSTI